MQLYPAIDLLAGQSVRLTQGDYRQVSLLPTADSGEKFNRRWS